MGIGTIILILLIILWYLEGEDRIAKSTEEVFPDLLEDSSEEREVPRPSTSPDSLGEQ